MVSIERCRRILGDSATLTDSEIERLRDDLYGLATILAALAVASPIPGASSFGTHASARPAFPVEDADAENEGPGGQDALGLIDGTNCTDIEERAAIMEYDGNMPRTEAERAAIVDFRKRRQPRA